MKKAIIIVGVVLILFVLVGSLVLHLSRGESGGQVSQQRVWQVPIGGGEVETLEVTDLNGDGQDETLAQTPGEVLLLGPDGGVLLQQNVANAKATLGDLNGDRVEDFVLARPEGDGMRVVAYTGDGTAMWESLVPAVGAPARGLTLDFEGDGQREAVFGTDAGLVVVLEGVTGTQRWQYAFPADTQENLLVRGSDDVALNGRRLLAVADYGGHVTLLDASGTPVWETDFPEQIRRLRAYDMNGDGASEMLVGGLNGLIWLLSAAGDGPLWQASLGGRVDEARFLELDGDPTQREVVAGGKHGGVAAYTLGGTPLWQRTLGGKVRELVTLDYNDDGQNELLVAADRVYLLGGPNGQVLATFPATDPSVVEVGDFGQQRGFVVGASGQVSAFQLARKSAAWWSSPLLPGFVLALILGALTVILTRFEWEKKTVYSVQDASPEVLKAKKKMLREVLDDLEQVYRRGELSGPVYLERSREERERLVAVEEQILKLEPSYKPEVMRCPACAAPLELGLDRCPYCNHVLL